MKFKMTTAFAALLAVAVFSIPASAQNVIRWASQGDALTSDPHAANESPTHSASRKVYDTLTYNDKDMVLTPWLATSWKLTDDPTVWEFELRKGVKFHDGTDLTATDVKFSFERAKSDTSDISGDVSSIKEVKIINDHDHQIAPGRHRRRDAIHPGLGVRGETDHSGTERQIEGLFALGGEGGVLSKARAHLGGLYSRAAGVAHGLLRRLRHQVEIAGLERRRGTCTQRPQEGGQADGVPHFTHPPDSAVPCGRR